MFQIVAFDHDKFHDVIYRANKGNTPLSQIKESTNLSYLISYLGPNGLNAKYYAYESDFINYDYLSDFAFYYSKCFHDYGTKCVRIHFFTSNLSLLEFQRTLNRILVEGSGLSRGTDQYKKYEDFWHVNYLGFVVIRPIPGAFLGYTLLKHYNYISNEPDRISRYEPNRVFWGVKDYVIHICGNPIKISNTLAFMSQDGNVSACATIAIWCMLHRAVEDYFICLKSPNEITRDAGELKTNGDRIFPNTGLDLISMCRAVSKSNVAPIVIAFFDDSEIWKDANHVLKKYVYAYSGLHLPIILGITVPYDGIYEGHAIAVCGHSMKSKNRSKSFLHKKRDINWESDEIGSLYVHDDQFGPFAKILLNHNNKIYTSWTSKDLNSIKRNDKPAFPMALIIPVYQKVRIPFQDIHDCALGLHSFFMETLSTEFESQPTWSIQAKFASDFKVQVQSKKYLDIENPFENEILSNFLKESLPKYIWVSTLIYKGEDLIYFIYDATALKFSDCLLVAFSFDLEFWRRFIEFVDSLKDKERTEKEDKMLTRFFSTTIEKFSDSLSKIYINAENEINRQQH